MWRKVFFIVLFILNFLIAQDFDLDYTTFRGENSSVVVEVSLLIPRSLLKFVTLEDGGYGSLMEIRVAIAQRDTVVVWDRWILRDRTSDTLLIKRTQKIPELAVFEVKPGDYEIVAVVVDLNAKKKYIKKEKVSFNSYSSRKLEISGIELCSQMSRTEKENKFSRYFGYDLVPNASAIFGFHAPQMYTFCEVYNLEYGPGKDGKYSVEYEICDLDGDTVMEIGEMRKNKPGDSAVEINSIDVRKLESGIYKLVVTVRDPVSGQSATAEKKFYVVNEESRENVDKVLVDFMYANMSEEELDRIFGPLKYIATEDEKKRYKRATLEGKRKIVAHFWDNRDPDPSTEVNEARVEFMKRLEYANQHFGNIYLEGWATDMGRVLIQYGFPSEVERYNYTMGTKPYQIWHYYEIEGGVIFVFVDKTGYGVMELVHSTARKELHDEDWQRWIKQ